MKNKPTIPEFPPCTVTCTGPLKKITATEFRHAVALDPSWAVKLIEPVEIIGFCNMERSKITHLSPLLIFSGRDENGTSANFTGCKHLNTAEGCFNGNVVFSASGVSEIGDLVIRQPDTKGRAVSFRECRNLKVATGSYPGSVDFGDSGIERIGHLVIKLQDTRGAAATFEQCEALRVAQGRFPGSVNFSKSGVDRIGDLRIARSDSDGLAALFEDCAKLQVARGRFPGFASFDRSGVQCIDDDFMVFRKAGDYIAWPNASFVECPLIWNKISNKCLSAIMLREYIGIWETAVDVMVAREKAGGWSGSANNSHDGGCLRGGMVSDDDESRPAGGISNRI